MKCPQSVSFHPKIILRHLSSRWGRRSILHNKVQRISALLERKIPCDLSLRILHRPFCGPQDDILSVITKDSHDDILHRKLLPNSIQTLTSEHSVTEVMSHQIRPWHCREYYKISTYCSTTSHELLRCGVYTPGSDRYKMSALQIPHRHNSGLFHGIGKHKISTVQYFALLS